jgi:hypothetical protein
VIRRRFVQRLRGRPRIDYNEIVQADTIKGFVTVCSLGLLGSNGCGYAAVGEGHGIVSADHIKPIPKRNIFLRTAIAGFCQRIFKVEKLLALLPSHGAVYFQEPVRKLTDIRNDIMMKMPVKIIEP